MKTGTEEQKQQQQGVYFSDKIRHANGARRLQFTANRQKGYNYS